MTLSNLLQLAHKQHWVVLMAGGRGQRLLPLTEELPEPLLSVGPRANS